MAGLQELAAVIGIAEVAFRAISSLYDFVKDLQDVPLEIERIKAETSTLDQTLRYLSSLDATHIELCEISERTGLARAVNRCGAACDRLLRDLYRWTTNSRRNTISKIQFRLHRRAFQQVISEIDAAKQTTILALGVAQICLQLKKPVSESEEVLQIRQGWTEIAMFSKPLKPQSDVGPRRRSRKNGSKQSESPNEGFLLPENDSKGKEMVVYEEVDVESEGDESSGGSVNEAARPTTARNTNRRSKQETFEKAKRKEKLSRSADEISPAQSRNASTPRSTHTTAPPMSSYTPTETEIEIRKTGTGAGVNNFIGADKDVIGTLRRLKIDDVHTGKGSNNFVGIGDTTASQRSPRERKG